MLKNLLSDLDGLSDSRKAQFFPKFFKTGKGQYGEGDKFLGITVPKQRQIAKKYINLNLIDIKKLLNSKIHEHRFTALLILVAKYSKSDDADKKEIFNFYLESTDRINNWDLVDTSAPYIVGDYLIDKDKKVLLKLARSTSLWERRIAIVATYAFIKNLKFSETLKISELLLSDKHDLIHKAVGWMLREVGKKDINVLKNFLETNSNKMPRTALRYAIERMDPKMRYYYMGKK